MEVNNGSLARTRPMFAVVCFDLDLAKIFKMRCFKGPTEKQTIALYNNASCFVLHLLKLEKVISNYRCCKITEFSLILLDVL